MAEAAGIPQARLIFHASIPADSPPAPLSPHQTLAFWGAPKPHHHLVGPSPAYLVEVQGDFGLEQSGGVRVAHKMVQIPRGTFVGRAFGAEGTESGSLWWMGLHKGTKGVWTLGLLGADSADLLAVHRILLFLPPLPQPSRPFILPQPLTLPRPRPLPTTRTLGAASSDPIAELQSSFAQLQRPQYRNSLLLVDDDPNEVIAILPIESLTSPVPTEATFPIPSAVTAAVPASASPATSTPSITSSGEVTPPTHTHSPSLERELAIDPVRGRALANQVEIVRHLSPGRPREPKYTIDPPRQAKRGEEGDGGDRQPDGGGRGDFQQSPGAGEEGEWAGIFVGLPAHAPPVLPLRPDYEPSAAQDDDDEELGPNALKKLQHGFDRLDAEMGSLNAFVKTPASHPSPLAPQSATEAPAATPSLVADVDLGPTVVQSSPTRTEAMQPAINHHQEDSIMSTATLATLGTERRFVPATEGHDDESRRTSSATFTTSLEFDEGEDGRPFPFTTPSATQPRHVPSLSVLSIAPEHALTPSNDNGNSVLLRFLGASSTITTRLVSTDEICRQGLVPATVGAEEYESSGSGWWSMLFGGWGAREQEGRSGWASWLRGWWSSSTTITAETARSGVPNPSKSPSHPSETINAPTSYPSNFFTPTSSSLATPRSRPRRANGEATSRLSIIHFDDDGYGRAAYVEGAGGGFGARGVAGVGGGY